MVSVTSPFLLERFSNFSLGQYVLITELGFVHPGLGVCRWLPEIGRSCTLTILLETASLQEILEFFRLNEIDDLDFYFFDSGHGQESFFYLGPEIPGQRADR